jgi:septal ring factor EnvC (AmiA/AmiB activator)
MRRRIVIVPLIAALSLAAGLALAAPALRPALSPDPTPPLRQIEAEQHDREQDRDQAQARAQAISGEIAALQAQLDELDAAQQAGERSVSDKRLRLAALNAREGDLKARLGGQRAQLARLLAVLELFRRDPPPALFVDPHDVRDAIRAAILIRAITPELERRADALKAQTLDLQRMRRDAATASEDLFTSESSVADRRARIETLIAKKTMLEHQASAEASAASQDVETLSARARALRDLTRGVVDAPPPAGAAPPDPEHAGLFGKLKPFTPPTPGAPIRRFGELDPGGHSRSQGWTWRTTDGAQIVAPAQGVVDYAGSLKGWGVVLILRLGGGYHLVLAGLETALAAPGRMVAAGEPVGQMAKVGQTPPEFYLEVRKNGAPIDPGRWLKAPTTSASRR